MRDPHEAGQLLSCQKYLSQVSWLPILILGGSAQEAEWQDEEAYSGRGIFNTSGKFILSHSTDLK